MQAHQSSPEKHAIANVRAQSMSSSVSEILHFKSWETFSGKTMGTQLDN